MGGILGTKKNAAGSVSQTRDIIEDFFAVSPAL
jgi:hypothetical protein